MSDRVQTVDPHRQMRLVVAEGSYDSVEEWERDGPVTEVVPFETMAVLVFGPPRSPNFKVWIPEDPVEEEIDALVRAYLRED